MKFGQLLAESLDREYHYQYVDYTTLKLYIKSNLKDGGWTESHEAAFLELLEQELEKVYMFQKVKSNEVKKRMLECQHIIQETLKSSVDYNKNSSARALRDDQFEGIGERLTDVIADVHELAEYCDLNYTAFYKIIKKHDKQTRWTLRPIFAARLASKPFYREDYNPLIVKLSQLYDLTRNRGHSQNNKFQVNATLQQNFVRQTTKYWVHPNNVTKVKLYILTHLPVLVFNVSKEYERKDTAITSIYLDNKEMDLYRGRLQKIEGAEAIRFRWYGPSENANVYVERKTHHEDWTGEKSIKARFPIKEKYINRYLQGNITSEKLFEKARKDGKNTQKDIEDMKRLCREIQFSILSKNLKPKVRSFYNRVAFQLPGNARVRISLDTDLCSIREDSMDGVQRSGDNWRRKDIDIDAIFENLPDSDITRFPYAVLEVKLQTQFGQGPPQWVQNLVNSELVESVPWFSKYIHGISTLLPDRVSLIPYWLPQMNVNIYHVESMNFDLNRSYEFSNGMDDLENLEEVDKNYTSDESTSEDEDTSYGNLTFKNRCKLWKSRLHRVYDIFRSPLNVIFEVEPFKNTPELAYDKTISAPHGKKIAIPFRVEPKTFFALERTFICYVDFALVNGTIAIGLLNFADSTATILTAFAFLLITVLTMIYSLLSFLRRALAVHYRQDINYDDFLGPIIMTILLLSTLGGNFILNFFFTKNSALDMRGAYDGMKYIYK